jgi:hypothetical protein
LERRFPEIDLFEVNEAFGLQVMCEAGGLANATIIERI